MHVIISLINRATVLSGHEYQKPNPFENASQTAFIFVAVVLFLVIGYGVAKMIWGED